MRSKIFIMIITIAICSNIFAQDAQRFLGIYDIQEVCTCSTAMPNYIDTVNYEIEITTSSIDTFDIQFYLIEHLQDTIRAKITGDNTFLIPSQTFQSYDNTNLYISGNGALIQDSLVINYNSGSSIGLFECTCKGKKRNNASLSDYKDKRKFDAYPNPTCNSISIEIEKEYTELKIEIMDEMGKLVYSNNEIDNPISLDGFASGIYFVQLKIDGKVTTGKIVVE